MSDNIERKRVTLHPLKPNGLVDETVNLYPKTFLDGIVDRDGNEVEVATKEDVLEVKAETQQDIASWGKVINKKQDKLTAGDNLVIKNGVISTTGVATSSELNTAVNTIEQQIGQIPLGDVTQEMLNEALKDKASFGFLDLNDYLSEEDLMLFVQFCLGFGGEYISLYFNTPVDLAEFKDNSDVKVHYTLHDETSDTETILNFKVDYINNDIPTISLILYTLDSKQIKVTIFDDYIECHKLLTDFSIIAPTWISGEHYKKHDFVIYESLLYQCTHETWAEEFSLDEWRQRDISEVLNEKQTKLKNAQDDNSIILNDRGNYTSIKVNTENIQERLTAGENITIENNVISSTGGSGSVSEWGDIAGTLNNQTDLANELDNLLQQLAPAWNSTTAYLKDSMVVWLENRKLYICIADVPAGYTPANSQYWKLTTMSEHSADVLEDELNDILEESY